MVKYLFILLIFITSWLYVPPVMAAFCHSEDAHRVCIVSIKRSAKNYWQYQTEIAVDGVKKPIVVYNCRTKEKISLDSSRLPLDPTGKIICKLPANRDKERYSSGHNI
ncbi:MAG: hypothetical protein N5P05_003396 [Chroococcopsis gigantea SAG 12.99]|jgi:hypothetical protein|nr:hypothetical protein [Chlorogloea purpurea SAG 13.99]MDV3001790.1 hypothetical protein [Chroococcopsis gigantea SAG 12.99]